MRQPKIVLGRPGTSPTIRTIGWHLHPDRAQATSILTRGSRQETNAKRIPCTPWIPTFHSRSARYSPFSEITGINSTISHMLCDLCNESPEHPLIFRGFDEKMRKRSE